MALSPDLKSAWLPLPRTTMVVLIEDFQEQPHTQRRWCSALPTQNLFPLANLNSHHEKTLKRTEIHPAPTGQHPAFQSQKHRCRPLAQPGVLHFRRTKIIWAHSIRHKATLPELHGQGGDGMPAWHFQPEPSPWEDAFPPQNHTLFPNTDPKTRGNESGTRRDLQGVRSSSR